MDHRQFDTWLSAYGDAWESRDASRFCALFSADASYYWTPLDPPIRGRPEISAAFTDAVSTQEAIRFSYQMLAVVRKTGICRWQCSFDRAGSAGRVRLDGVFVACFDGSGLCVEFREWWHSTETAGDAGTG